MRGAVQTIVLVLLVLGAASPGCVRELEVGQTVVLPPESVRFERFIQADTDLTADRVTVQAVTAYRADVAVIVDEQLHAKEITPSRISLTSHDRGPGARPVSLSFRNMRIRARERIDVVFSDIPLMSEPVTAPILLVVAEGVASVRGSGVDLVADRIVIRNDEIKGFEKNGEPLPPNR